MMPATIHPIRPRIDLKRSLDALIRLGIERASPLDEPTQTAYLEGVRLMPHELVEAACRQLGREPRAPYSTPLPSLGDIIDRCQSLRRQAESAAVLPQLREARPQSLTRDEARAWVNRLQRDVEARRRARRD